jgi:hypothetical protein
MKWPILVLIALFIGLVLIGISSASPADGITAYYGFNEGTGISTTDLTGNNYVGNLSTPEIWDITNPKLGYSALNLTKNPTKYVNTSLNILGNLTINCWILPRDIITQSIIVSNFGGSNYTYIWQFFDKNLRFTLGNADSDGNFQVNLDSYVMISVVAEMLSSSSWNIKHFINGSMVNSSTHTVSQHPGLGITTIGARYSGEGSNYTLDECGFWNRVLNTSDLLTLYNSGAGYDLISKSNVSFDNITNLDGDTLYDYNITLTNGSLYYFTSFPAVLTEQNAGNNLYTISPRGYWPVNITIDVPQNTLINVNVTGLYNAILRFRGQSTGLFYQPTCLLNGIAYTPFLNGTTIAQTGLNVLNCSGSQFYNLNTEFTQDAGIPTSLTFNLTEYNLVLTIKDEITQAQAIGINVSLDFVSSNHSYFYSTLTGNLSVDDIASGQYTLIYSAINYTSRQAYIIVPEIPGQVTMKTIYLLPDSQDYSNISIIVIDQTSLPLEGAVVKAKRHYPAQNTYIVVDESITDQDGTVALDLFKYTVLYEFVVQYKGQTLLQTIGSTIKKDQITLQVNTGQGSLAGWQRYESIDYSILFNPTTGVFSSVYNNVDGFSANMCLKSYSISLLAEVQLDSVCDTSSAATITLASVINLSGATYEARLYFTDGTTGLTYLLDKYSYTYADSFTTGKTGLFFQILITLAAIGVSISNPKWMLLSVPLSLVIGRLFFLNSWPYWMLFGILLAGIIVMWGVDKRS